MYKDDLLIQMGKKEFQKPSSYKSQKVLNSFNLKL
jgi:hypothetical protein